MGARERPVDRGTRLGRAAILSLGAELRRARAGRGLSIQATADGIGLSAAEVSRIERGLSPKVPFITLARFAAAVGLDLVAKLYPGPGALRDRGQASILEDLATLLDPSLRWDLEVPLPISGDQRAWDSLIRGPDWRFGVEVESAPNDAQAIIRRVQLKQRDGMVDGVILAVRDTRTVRSFLADAASLLPSMFPASSGSAIRALRQGRKPGGNAIVIVPRTRRPPT